MTKPQGMRAEANNKCKLLMYIINVNNSNYYYEARARKNIFSLSSPPYIFKIVCSAHVALRKKDDWSWSSFDFIKRGVAHLQIKTKCNG